MYEQSIGGEFIKRYLNWGSREGGLGLGGRVSTESSSVMMGLLLWGEAPSERRNRRGGGVMGSVVVGDLKFNGVGDLREEMQLQKKCVEEADAIVNLGGTMKWEEWISKLHLTKQSQINHNRIFTFFLLFIFFSQRFSTDTCISLARK